MNYLYPEDTQPFQFGQKFYWGSLYGSAQALALIEFVSQEKRVVLVIANDIEHHQKLRAELNFYNHDLPILNFDSSEVLAFDHFSPHPDIIANRLRTLSQLSQFKYGIVIATLESLMQRLCPLEFVAQYSFDLRINDPLDSHALSEQLIKIGYLRTSKVMECGEFSIRGSLIDLYPMGASAAYRLDLLDQEIESIRTFDTQTQRSIALIEQIKLLPAREFSMDNVSIERFKNNYASEFGAHADFILTEVSERRLPRGIEFYLPLFFAQTNTLFDYLPADFVVAHHQGLNELVAQTYQHIDARHALAKKDLDRPPLPVDQVFLNKDALFSQLKQQPQLVIAASKRHYQKDALNFASKLLPPLSIEAQSKHPLAKYLNFATRHKRKILLVCESRSRQSVLSDLLENNGLSVHFVQHWQAFVETSEKLCITRARLEAGLLTAEMAVITETQLFGTEAVQQRRRRRAKHKDFDEAIKSLVEINTGDAIVHENYGVGRYLGLTTHSFDGQEQDLLTLEYANGTKLMVPMEAINLVSRYSGASGENAPLHKLGTPQWNQAKKKACEALHDVAAELLEIYAKRAATLGFAFPEPADGYSGFVADFPFEETPDQLKTMDEVLSDMQAPKPMDRLVCGDVGFGKTEIAMRAAFLSVEAGKQVIILVPTTLLANQHHQSFVDRFVKYPVQIAVLSRFQTPSEQKRIKQGLLSGGIDIVIGTHKLIHGSIQYKNLGLIIIDEEHRFGVKQKESLKKIRGHSDILTMTATPIPRTLNMALGSLRDLSIIATPPEGRSAIQTMVSEWHEGTIKEACERELHRGGQIFVVHNEIDSIDNITETLQNLMPNVQMRIAHGQMPVRELEHIMGDFYHGRFQLLVCTTIIETGIDIPSANTIIINNAQNFGLAQLHQLRGRVGRSHHRAYAYLMIKSHQSLSKNAKKRLEAIESLEELGAGFMLANHDLEIRGAGDLLGDKQSGKINEIGFNLYHDLLKRAIAAIRSGSKLDLDAPAHNEVEIDSGIACIIPQTYLYDVHERLVLYKRIASAKNKDELKELTLEMIDRFGLLPDSVKNLYASAQLKLLAQTLNVQKISIYEDKAHLIFGQNTCVEPMAIIRLIQQHSAIYQLKGERELILKKTMPHNIQRFEIIEALLLSLS